MFVLDLTIRAWYAGNNTISSHHFFSIAVVIIYVIAEKQKRRTLQKEDIEDAIKDTEIFDFLVGLSSPSP